MNNIIINFVDKKCDYPVSYRLRPGSVIFNQRSMCQEFVIGIKRLNYDFICYCMFINPDGKIKFIENTYYLDTSFLSNDVLITYT